MKEYRGFVSSSNVGLPLPVEEEKKGEGKAKKRQKKQRSVSGFTGCHDDGAKQNFIGGVGFGVMPAAKKP